MNTISTISKKLFQYSAPITLLIFLSIDFLLIGLHIIARVTPPPDPRILLLDRSWTIPEMFQYLKEIVVATVVLFIFIKGHYKQPIYLAWGALFAYMFFDDAFEVHEQLGKQLYESNAFGLGSLGEFLDEIIVFAAIGLFFSSIIFYFYRRTKNEQSKEISRLLLLLLMFFAFFSVFVDAVHSVITNYTRANFDSYFVSEFFAFILDIIEEGGEMIAFSLMLGTVAGLYYLIDLVGSMKQVKEQSLQSGQPENITLVYYEAADQFTVPQQITRISWMKPVAQFMQWSLDHGLMVNYGRIELIKAIKVHYPQPYHLFEYQNGIGIYLPQLAVEELNQRTAAIQQQLAKKNLDLIQGHSLSLNQEKTLDDLTQEAFQNATLWKPVAEEAGQTPRFSSESADPDAPLGHANNV